MNVLIYYTPNAFTVAGISLCRKLKAEGHGVFFLTQHPEGVLHEHLRKEGVNCIAVPLSSGNKIIRYVREIFYVKRFIKKNNIDIVFSHLGANLISIWAQYLTKAPFYLTRHHTDELKKYGNWKGRLADRMVIKLGKKIISICTNVTNHLIEEGCSKEKIVEIPLAYDFDLYAKPDASTIKRIRNEYPAKLLLVAVSRHVAPKRHKLLIETLEKMILQEKLDIKCLILDRGPLTDELKSFVVDKKLDKHVFFIGYTDSVMDYISAADLIPHFSDSEASNSVIKEAGILKRVVAVCESVGDFDDYIVAGVNGFKMKKDNPVPDFEGIVNRFYSDASQFAGFGEKLREEVINRFSIEKVYPKYQAIINELERPVINR